MKPREFTSPEEAEKAFYEAFESGDIDAMMTVWAADETIVCVHPGSGRLVGAQEIRESWRQIFSGTAKLSFRVSDIESFRSSNVCVRSVHEYISVEGSTGLGAPVIATNVFVLTDDGWRMWMHHASGAMDEDVDADDDTPPTLH